MTVHDVSYARAPELFSRRDRSLLRFVRGSVRRAARVIAVSEFTRADVMRPLRPRSRQGGRDPERRGHGVPAAGRRKGARARALRHRPPVHALRRRAAAAQERAARDRGVRAADRSRHGLRARRRGRRPGWPHRSARRDPAHAPDGPRPPRRPRRGRGAAGALRRGARARVPLALRGFRASGPGGHGLRHAGDREQHDRARGSRRRCRAHDRPAQRGRARRCDAARARRGGPARAARRRRLRARCRVHVGACRRATADVYREALA